MGGKPSKGTRADKRLKENKAKLPSLVRKSRKSLKKPK